MSAPLAVLADVKASLGGVEAALVDRQDDQARHAHAAALRSLQALGVLLGVAPAPVPVSLVPARDQVLPTRGCRRCGSTVKQPVSGFGPPAGDICGACGYDDTHA